MSIDEAIAIDRNDVDRRNIIERAIDGFARTYVYTSSDKRERAHTQTTAIQMIRGYAGTNVELDRALRQQFFDRVHHYRLRREQQDPKYQHVTPQVDIK